MRVLSAVLGILFLCAPALADTAADEPATIIISDPFSKGGLKKIKPDWKEINKHALGSPGNPVRADMPAGEEHYLARLRCPSGRRPDFNLDGSDGRGPYTSIMDVFTLTCPKGDKMDPQRVFMDRRHPNYHEDRPVKGFSIAPRLIPVYPQEG